MEHNVPGVAKHMKIKHEVTVTIYEDDTVDYKFKNADGWPVGKMQRQLNRATRYLKAEHRKIAKAQADERAAAAAKQAEDDAAEAERMTEAKALGKSVEKTAAKGDLSLVEAVKAAQAKLLNEGEENADDTGTGGGDAGETLENDGDSGDGTDESDGKSE